MAPPTSENASPIGIANLPNQRVSLALKVLPDITDLGEQHKIVAKRGAAFTIMVAGESGLGKTTFINTLVSNSPSIELFSSRWRGCGSNIFKVLDHDQELRGPQAQTREAS